MFTVIFAEKEKIKLFKETKMFFEPLLDEGKIAFCEWDREATTFDLMVSDLYKLIEYKSEWRAVVLNDDGLHKLNPFDYTMYAEPYYSNETKDWAYYRKRRDDRFAAYEQATTNPLVKLTIGLCGLPNFKMTISEQDVYDAIISGELSVAEYMLERQLAVLDCSELAAQMNKYQREKLRKFVNEENIDQLIIYVKNADASGIINLIPETEVLEFIKYIGNDPIYYDPEYTECIIENTKKSMLLAPLLKGFSLKDKLPTEVICLSQRTFDVDSSEQDVKWKKRDEASYSKFADFNLYHDKLRFLLFDILPVDHKQYKFDEIKFLCMLLIVSSNPLPQGMVNPSYVYRVNIDFDAACVSKLCENYVSKLRATEFLLKDIEVQFGREGDESLDDKTVRRLFESDVQIPVKIDIAHSPSDLFADYKHIGLATDCPEPEDVNWSNQYRKINKNFTKYLREPRRAIKTAVTDNFQQNNSIEDEPVFVLSETQAEDIRYHLIEEEQKMNDTTTSQVFDTKYFMEQLQEADSRIKRRIAQRMTRKKILLTGLFAIVVYAVGFLPMVFGSLNTFKSFLFSLLIAGIVMVLFIAGGYIYLRIQKKKLQNDIKHFNYAMSGNCNTINGSLAQFSKYLSCACNVMRDFSCLQERESNISKLRKVLQYHRIQITDQIKSVYEMFSRYVDLNGIAVKECDPYEYDFTVVKEYAYPMPSISSKKRIDFLQQGNEIVIPVDYVESITLIREELYD